MNKQIREAVGDMTTTQKNDALYSIELRAREITARPRNDWPEAYRHMWDLAQDVLNVIASARSNL